MKRRNQGGNNQQRASHYDWLCNHEACITSLYLVVLAKIAVKWISWAGVVAALLAGCSGMQDNSATTTALPTSQTLTYSEPWALDIIVVTGPADVGDLAGNNSTVTIEVPNDAVSLGLTSSWVCKSGPACHMALAVQPDGEVSRVVATGDSPLNVTIPHPSPGKWELIMRADVTQPGVVMQAQGTFHVTIQRDGHEPS